MNGERLCKHGHEQNLKNCYTNKSNGKTRCRLCSNLSQVRSRKREKKLNELAKKKVENMHCGR